MATNQGSGNSPKKSNRVVNSELVVSSNGSSREDGQQRSSDEVNGVAAHGQQQEPQQQAAPQAGVFQIIRSLAMNAIIVYFIVNFFRSKPQTAPVTTGGEPGLSSAPQPSLNMFPNGMAFDMYVYVSEKEHVEELSRDAVNVWTQTGLVYGDWYGGAEGDGTYKSDVQIPVSERVQQNGTLYLHVYLVKSGRSPDPKDETYSKRHTVYRRRMLNKYKKKKYTKTHNLLTGETTASAEAVMKAEKMKEEILSHWHPNLTINVINDQTPWIKGSIPPPLDEYIEFELVGSKYYPVVFFNDYWNLVRDYTPINSTTQVLNLTLTYQPLSLFRWQLYTAQSTRNKWTSSLLGEGMMEESDEDQDTLKETFLETSPYLLGLTVIISICHSVCEFMAFKNDIQFWKSRNNLEGLSVRSVFFNVFQSLIVLLYVLDNDTNTVVRISVFVGLVIELWKIQKVVNVQLNRQDKILGFIPRIKISDKGSYVESSTKQYDMLAFRYLSWALYPLLIGYAVYSLLYVEHKGWYSWVLSMLYGFLLTFGFIMMTPQLFINYKLKSVAHLPWRMMTYKALNTFIDDIFAFVIKMPTMYRIGCFRDDIVFFIFLYQRWIYRVDPTRVNEFGTSGDADAPAPVDAPAPQEPTAAIMPPPSSSPAKKNSRRKKTD